MGHSAFRKDALRQWQLLALYSQAHLATGEPLFARIAAETADWAVRDMRSPEGGFYSSLDADSEGREGKFYLWDAAEVRGILNADEYRAFAARFGHGRCAEFRRRLALARGPSRVRPRHRSKR